MAKHIKVDICAIGGGSGGLAVSKQAVRMGASAVLVERARMGGDCLNYGCVPSKALLAAGHLMRMSTRAHDLGISVGKPSVSRDGVFRHVHGVIEAIEPTDSAEHCRSLGVQVINAAARFISSGEIEAGGNRISARYFVIATGSVPVVPEIAGLDTVPFFTNETIFHAAVVPEHLIIFGGGALGIEMAQAHIDLGCRVTLLERDQILQKDDPELVGILRRTLIKDGVRLIEGASIEEVERNRNTTIVHALADGRRLTIEGSHLLVAAGRRAFTDGLALEAAGVEVADGGISVDEYLRTRNKRIYAIGDVIGRHQYAHMAVYHASIVLRNALLCIPSKADHRAVPWVTFSDPELAHVGYNETEARKKFGDIRVFRWPFSANDRALAEGAPAGLVKVITRANGQVVGATIIGSNAGELIQVWILMTKQKMKIEAFADVIVPYPTFGYASKYAAETAVDPARYGSFVRNIVRVLRWFATC